MPPIIPRFIAVLFALATAAGARAETVQVPLSQFLSAPGPIQLRRAAAFASFFLPVASRIVVDSAKLDLAIVNSHALVERRSQLRVLVNDRVIGQLPLDSQLPSVAAQLDLPPALLRAGFNKVSFVAAQHYTTTECEDERAAELWTDIDSERSRIELTFHRDLKEARLSDLPGLIHPGLGGTHRLTVLHPGKDVGTEGLAWAERVAEAVGIRLDFVPPVIAYAAAEEAEPGPDAASLRLPFLDQSRLTGDQVLVGTRDELAPLIGAEHAAAITDAYLGIVELDAAPDDFLLIVSGTTGAEVARAARALSLSNYELADSASALIKAIDVPDNFSPEGRVNVRPNALYALGDLGFATRTLTGDRTSLRLVLPPDLYTGENAKVEFDLHFAYGAGLRSDSVLQLFLNGVFETSIHLDNVNGAELRDYRVQVPVRSFRPGANEVAFVPVLEPLVTGQCMLRNNDNAQLTLFDDSQLVMPPADRLALVPDLERMGRTAYPYVLGAHGDDLVYALSQGDDATASAALTLAAKLAQIKGAPIDATVTLNAPPKDKNVIVIGPAGSIDPSLLAAAPVGIGSEKRVPAGALRVAAEEPAPGVFDRWIADTRDLFGVPPPATARRGDGAIERLLQLSSLGRDGVMMSFPAPSSDRTVVTLVAARDAASLVAAVDRLVSDPFWSQLKGDVIVWRNAPETVTTAAVGKQFAIDNLGPLTRAGWLASQNPLLWVGAAGLIVFAFAGLTTQLIRRKIRRRNRGA